MTKPNSTEIVVILDRSGSMTSLKKDIQGGFDSFIAEQRKLPGECFVSLVRFDDTTETVYTRIPLASVPKLDLVPRGNTALFDAVGRTIAETGARFASMREEDRPSQVVLLILTDGENNASVEFTQQMVREAVEHQTGKYSWTVSFLGTNQDAVLTAKQMGIAASNTISYRNSGVGVKTLFNNVSGSFAQHRRSGLSYTANLVSQDSYDRDVEIAEEDVKSAAVVPGFISSIKSFISGSDGSDKQAGA